MKLSDFRKRFREVATPPAEVGRHPSGAMFIGIDHASPRSLDKTVMTCFRREADGTMTLIKSEEIRNLHHFEARVEGAHQNLCNELVEPIRSSGMPHGLGASFMDRYFYMAKQTWMDNNGVDGIDLAIVMGDAGHGPSGRVTKRDDSQPLNHRNDDYLVFVDNAFRMPILCRYLKTGIEGGRPVIYVQTDNTGSVRVGHGACFYPAETVPCPACEETGHITEAARASGAVAPSTRIGAGCPACLGLTRIWRCRPWAHPEALTKTPITFAEANPARWHEKVTY